MKNLKSIKGFTLIELMIVVAIIGILMAMIVPVVQLARVNAHRKLLGEPPLERLDDSNSERSSSRYQVQPSDTAPATSASGAKLNCVCTAQ